MASTPLTIELIASDPAVRSGRPVVAGTTVCVSDIAAALIFRQQTPDEIALGYRLSLAQVHAALAYYYQHQADIDADIRQRATQSDRMKEQGVGRSRNSARRDRQRAPDETWHRRMGQGVGPDSRHLYRC